MRYHLPCAVELDRDNAMAPVEPGYGPIASLLLRMGGETPDLEPRCCKRGTARNIKPAPDGGRRPRG